MANQSRKNSDRKEPAATLNDSPALGASLGEINEAHQAETRHSTQESMSASQDQSVRTDRTDRADRAQRATDGSLSGDLMTPEAFRENMEEITDEMRERANQMAKDVTERARVYYGEANQWLQENYSKALTAVGVLAAAGMVGYFMARKNRGSEKRRSA